MALAVTFAGRRGRPFEGLSPGLTVSGGNGFMGRVVGMILVGAGIAVGVLAGTLMATYVAGGELSAGAAVLGFTLAGVAVVLPLVGGGAYLWLQGAREAATLARLRQERRLLDVVKTRGQIDIAELALELNLDRQQTQARLDDLVGKGLFSGYVNWDEGVLYSEQASRLRDLTRCNVCQGELTLAGQGVIRCPYCGTEYFLE